MTFTCHITIDGGLRYRREPLYTPVAPVVQSGDSYEITNQKATYQEHVRGRVTSPSLDGRFLEHLLYRNLVSFL